MSELDMQQFFSLSKRRISANSEKFRDGRRVAAAIQMLFLRASRRRMVERCEMTDPSTGMVSEAEMTAGGVPLPLSQIQILGDQIRLSRPDNDRIVRFLDGLKQLLGDSANLIRKRRIDDRAQLEVTELTQAQGAYEVRGTSSASKPQLGIWLDSSGGPDRQAVAVGWPRLFRRSRGQYVLRVMEEADAAVFLALARKYLPTLSATAFPAPTAIHRPSVHVHVGMAMAHQDVFRPMAKIGVNLACHAHGHIRRRIKECVA